MKIRNLILLLLFLCSVCLSFAQADTSLLYLRFPTVPPFNLIKVPDSTHFTKDDLSKKKATLIMAFSPDCEHCQEETRQFIAHIDLFKKVQIIMTSPLQYSILKKFYDEYGLAGYPNFIIGRDPGYFLGTFYKIRSFPSLFLYDKKGNFLNKFDGSVPVERIAEELNN